MRFAVKLVTVQNQQLVMLIDAIQGRVVGTTDLLEMCDAKSLKHIFSVVVGDFVKPSTPFTLTGKIVGHKFLLTACKGDKVVLSQRVSVYAALQAQDLNFALQAYSANERRRVEKQNKKLLGKT